ncbi:MAG: radical SAM protein [Pseudomonadota bacterium]|nr:radical SAM protein [Pseudomonadota bacterium]
MTEWLDVAAQVEALEDLPLDEGLVAEMQRRGREAATLADINFYTPTFKSFQTSEISGCGRNAWPAVSITGGDCKLQCDHCKAKILEPMIAARTPEALWQVVTGIIAGGAGGMLLTGGSNHRNEVEYDAFYPVIRRIKDTYPEFRIAVHTALAGPQAARAMADAGIDVAMMDVIGAQDTITQVYHLRRNVADFERTLESLVATGMKVVPHIVIGLHYGRLLGEWTALEIIARHRPAALVLVVVMPFYAPAHRPFVTPDAGETGRFFMQARAALPDIPLLLGCARPGGQTRTLIDTYAVMAGMNGMAHPSEGVVELAARLERRVRVTPACCSIAVGDEVMAVAGKDAGLELDLDAIVRQERERRRGTLGGIRVSGGGCCGTGDPA